VRAGRNAPGQRVHRRNNREAADTFGGAAGEANARAFDVYGYAFSGTSSCLIHHYGCELTISGSQPGGHLLLA
jgi:hypothetical protein